MIPHHTFIQFVVQEFMVLWDVLAIKNTIQYYYYTLCYFTAINCLTNITIKLEELTKEAILYHIAMVFFDHGGFIKPPKLHVKGRHVIIKLKLFPSEISFNI